MIFAKRVEQCVLESSVLFVSHSMPKSEWYSQQYDFTGICDTCGKKLWRRDKGFSLYKFKKVSCAEHSGDPYWMKKKLL